MPIASINPATGQTLRRFDAHAEAEIERRLALAAGLFPRWRTVSFSERAARLARAADILEARKQEWGRIMTLEMGKPIGAAIAEAEKCAWACRFYAEHAERFLADEPAATDASTSFVRYDPLGAVLAVMPWNFPFWQVFRFAAPALMAGNVGLLKHASNVPQCALAIEEIFQEAGYPEGAFQTLLIGAERVASLIEDPRIAAVTLTGSEGAGVSVGRAAGAQLKKTVLELGGSDPFIVMPSADVAAAAATAVKARTINNGQSCIAAKRFIVHEAVADEFERIFVERMAALKIGDPADTSVEIGPLATPAIAAEVDDLVRRSVAAGAKVKLGGKRLEGPGNFYAPTVLTDVPPDSPAAVEEIFGPVASLFRVKSLDEAIALANRTRFGLGASAWTRDEAERDRLVRGIEAGAVFINGMVKSDPRLPFGGIKKSGYGRELALQGIREFVNVKAVWIA
ncbi:MAG TPA: NAD-dependent succinate-semialdehyde dehydrogenase [Thermoanaerobaculia bacterium]|nr:NAD-dependent succinate-semialdehyde dehydrogenase [Thermoanaerobaculia bacterium]